MKVNILSSIVYAMAFAQALPIAEVDPHELQLNSNIEDTKSLFESVIDSVLTFFNSEKEQNTPCHKSEKSMEKMNLKGKHDGHYHNIDSDFDSESEDYPSPPSPVEHHYPGAHPSGDRPPPSPGKHHFRGPPPDKHHPLPPSHPGKHHFPGPPSKKHHPRPSPPSSPSPSPSSPSAKGGRSGKHHGGRPPSRKHVEEKGKASAHKKSDSNLNSNGSDGGYEEGYILIETEVDETS